MKKIKILMLVCLLTFCGTAWAEKFPDLGECTGNNVRLREKPDAKSEITGRVNKGDSFILLDVKKVNNQKWYLIDHPTKTGSAWIFGKYVKKSYRLKDSEHTPAHVIAMQLRLDYGITPEKTRALHGKPLEVLNDVYGNFAGLKYKGFTLEYGYADEKNFLTSISAGLDDDDKDTAEANFGPVKIGDDTKKLREIFGKNIRDEENFWCCDLPSGEVMYFNTDENNKISSMQWLIEEH